MRRALPVLVLAGLGVATTAVAQGGGDPGAPVVRSAAVLHLDGDRSCHGSAGVTLRVTPPQDVQLGWITVRVDGRQMVRLTGVGSGASVTVRLPRRGGRVAAAAETLDGQRLSRSRSYRSCVRRPTPPQPRREAPPVIVGGGEA